MKAVVHRVNPVVVMALVLVVLFLFSLTIGRYEISIFEIFDALRVKLSGGELSYKQDEILFLLKEIRLPRILAAILVGGALASSGAVYQAMFVNPLISPGTLGVLAGAGFGAAIGIVVVQSWVATQVLAFAFACIAVGLSVILSMLFARNTILVLVVGGMICMAFFNALTSFMKYVADPTSQLPELTYWLMGTFANATNGGLLTMGTPIVLGLVVLCFRGKLLNVMSLGEEEAMSLGINVKARRLEMIGIATLICACTVAIAGTIQWVGLVIPHVVRFIIGPDNRLVVPTSILFGAVYMLVLDGVVRSVLTVEVPIGIVTSIVCLPIFVFALYQNKGKWR